MYYVYGLSEDMGFLTWVSVIWFGIIELLGDCDVSMELSVRKGLYEILVGWVEKDINVRGVENKFEFVLLLLLLLKVRVVCDIVVVEYVFGEVVFFRFWSKVVVILGYLFVFVVRIFFGDGEIFFKRGNGCWVMLSFNGRGIEDGALKGRVFIFFVFEVTIFGKVLFGKCL